MKRIFLSITTLSLLAATNLQAEDKRPDDSMRMYRMQEIEVTATRATEKTPVPYKDITREQIAKNNYGFDIPTLLALTPSMIATSETGIGIGGTSMRLRGTDATRLNVTINGVAMNNPDSHSMYWYDTPDLISAVGTVQVQRGAGVSTNGTGAFGGAVNMTTAPLQTSFGGEATLSYGSYNTNKQAVQISSGLMGGHWVVDARLSHIGSNGYIDRGTTDLKSYMFQGAYYGGNTSVKLISFGGKARTYLTYNGVTKKDMALYGRRYHDSGQYTTSDGPFVLADGTHVNYYDDQTDNYLQINNQLIVNHRINDRWELNLTGFYTYGNGYYKQYKDDAALLEYGFAERYAYKTDEHGEFVLDEDGGKIKISKDLIRQKIMRNHLGGVNAAAFYAVKNLDLAFGGSWSYYTCPHWGELDWIQDNPAGLDPKAHWYENDVNKQDANLFVKANWQVARKLNLYADMQYRYVSYKAWGTNDNFYEQIDAMQPIDIDKQYHFFNPRAGLTYNLAKGHTLFASFAVAQKEPTRGDFTNRFWEKAPRAERLYDYELGYQFQNPKVSAAVNLYYMSYKDQLVLTGQIGNSYDAFSVNVPDSYRRGVELSASWRTTQWFTLSANATFSQNRIKNYVNKVVDYAIADEANKFYGFIETPMGETRISYSPETMGSVFFDFHIRGFEAVLQTQYVGEQYFVNYSNPNMRIDAYCVTNLNLGYTLRTKAARSVRFGLAVYNLFNAEYSNNGVGYSDAYEGVRTDHANYFPQAPLNVLANVTVKF